MIPLCFSEKIMLLVVVLHCLLVRDARALAVVLLLPAGLLVLSLMGRLPPTEYESK